MADVGNSSDAPRRGDGMQFLLMGGLLVVVMGLLAVLWIRERSQRVRWQNEAAQLDRELKSKPSDFQRLFPGATLATSMPAGDGAPAGTICREDLQPERVQFQGRLATVFTVSASAGKRIGFRPGDVVVVGPPPSSAPVAP